MADTDQDVDTDDLELDEDEAQALLYDALNDPDNTVTESDTDTDDGDGTDWKAEARKWQDLARKHEKRAKDNVKAASQAKTLEQQVAELRQQNEQREARDLERAGKLAVSQVHTRLAEAGIKRDDVSGLLDLVEPSRLLADGQPDDDAIARIADSLVKVAGRATPDPDQGQQGGKPSTDMNTFIRRAAGVIQ